MFSWVYELSIGVEFSDPSARIRKADDCIFSVSTSLKIMIFVVQNRFEAFSILRIARRVD